VGLHLCKFELVACYGLQFYLNLVLSLGFLISPRAPFINQIILEV